MDILSFRLDRQRCAVPLENVQEVLHATAVTVLPGGPDVIRGVVDVRGQLVPVFDARRRFGFPEEKIHPDHHFVLVRARGRLALLQVDRAETVASIDEGAMEDVREIVPGSAPLVGVGRVEDGLILIHDLDAFLSDAENSRLDTALRQAAGTGRDA